MADVTAAAGGNPFTESQGKMQNLMAQQADFSTQTQIVSAALQANGAATNLMTSGHQTAANNAKNVGQGMVESSRR